MRTRHSNHPAARCGALVGALAVVLSAAAQVPLPIPDTLSGSVIDLTVQEGTWEFHPGEVVSTFGVNGDLLGPTLMLDQGQQVTINVANTLPDITTMHWHGMHVAPMNDGGPHSQIFPGSTWSPSFTVLDRASTFWYHPHGQGMTDFQVSMGIAGMVIVRDPQEAALALPRTYGVDDIPLAIQTKAIVGGQIALHTGLDSVVIVNGARRPTATLPAQVVRLRCLNGTSERALQLGFSNNLPFHVIGTDGGLLPAPVQLTRMRLMSGERAELLVDLSALQGSSFQLMAYNSELPNGIIGSAQVGNGMATLDGYNDNALNGADFAILDILVGPTTADPITAVPATLVPFTPYDQADADITRAFTFAPDVMGPQQMIAGPFTINNALFDMGTINVTVPLGNTEVWSFTNNTMVGHPLHIHDIQFNILDRNGAAPDAWEHGWKDVVYVPAQGTARVITRFDDHADAMTPYMYHCHLLMHEDEGMMGQFLVVDPNGITGPEAAASLAVWPNPAPGGDVRISLPNMDGPVQLIVRDVLGREVHRERLVLCGGLGSLQLRSLSAGIYSLAPYDTRGRSLGSDVRILLEP